MDAKEILKEVPVFKGLDGQLIDSLILSLEEEEHPSGTRIIQEGTIGDSFFIILSGSVFVTKNTAENKEVIISEMGQNSYFGELTLIDNQPRSANVTTRTSTRLLRLRKSVFDKFIASHNEFAINFYRNCLHETINRIRETANNFTMSQDILTQKSLRLEKIDADLSHAKKIQDYINNSRILCDDKPLVEGVRQSYLYQPYLEVGGDFVNFHKENESQVGVIIADVMGHGISAAMATGVLRSAFAFFAPKYGVQPDTMLHNMNRHLCEVFSGLFATAYYAAIDITKKEVAFSTAGHMDPLFWRNSTQGFEKINIKGNGLGITSKSSYTTQMFPYEKGDKILFYTDGVTEQRNNKGEMYDLGQLQDNFKTLILEKNEFIIQRLFEALISYSGNTELQDDITFLLLEF